MELNRDCRGSNWLNPKGSGCGQGENRTADTRIFSPLTVPGLCVTIGRQLNESKRLSALRTRSIFRSKHIAANGSGKVREWSAPNVITSRNRGTAFFVTQMLATKIGSKLRHHAAVRPALRRESY